MKTSMKTILVFLTGLMAFNACVSNYVFEDADAIGPASELRPMTFAAGQEGTDAATRVAIDGLDIKWSEGDMFSLFDGSDVNRGNQAFVLKSGAGSTCAIFEGNAAEADTYYAVYPYAPSYYNEHVPTLQEVAIALGEEDYMMLEMWKMEYDEGYMDDAELEEELKHYYDDVSPETMALALAYFRGQSYVYMSGPQRKGNLFENVSIPSEQTVASGQSVDPDALLMIAESADDSHLDFKNICAFVKVIPKFDCAAIAIRSKGSQSLAGTVTVDYNGGVPSTTVTSDGSNEVVLAGAIAAGNPYYIAVRPESLSSGFTVEFLTAEKSHYYARSTGRTLALQRNNVTDLGEFETGGPWSVDSDTEGDDGNGHDWMLVIPTLKLATVHLSITAYASAEGQWGSDWVSMTNDDVKALYAAIKPSFSYVDFPYSIIIEGPGVLKYAKAYNHTYLTTQIWTSTSYDDQNQYYFWLGSGSLSTLDKIYTNGVWYKYTK